MVQLNDKLQSLLIAHVGVGVELTCFKTCVPQLKKYTTILEIFKLKLLVECGVVDGKIPIMCNAVPETKHIK